MAEDNLPQEPIEVAEVAKVEKPKVEKFVNPFDAGVTYEDFLNAIPKGKTVEEYCNKKIDAEQLEFLLTELEIYKKK